ncbi:trypsin-like peptidase domain-containing protein [Staphylococcus sp. 11007852]|uniref:trypsin-like peptidase domain-containing protein n=1 Tax=Staphylococcus sp. 11007852 TaxID=2714543 RepID=UPI001402D08F|nr:trypsin-like peptidase domain-containing protein [Staphylococcus sp. 11007852]NHM75850.1 trypsin-like peptidase domain-containing protein [Staphylococcus sp. 11007852]
MKIKILITSVIVLSTIVITTCFQNIQAQEAMGSSTNVNTLTDENGKRFAKYSPDNTLYCSTTMVTANIGITSRHCAGSKYKDGYIGAVYPGQSGVSTPYGMMNISTYIPNVGIEDIAIIKGKKEDQSPDYAHYMQDLKTIEVNAWSEEKLRSLKGQKVYSYGYPGNSIGSQQVRSEGEITDYNPVTKVLTTSIPTVEGQSGSGVFLKEGNQFLGVLYSRTLDNKGNVAPIDERLKAWFDKNTSQ